MATPPPIWYDYDNQAWVRDGVYIACGHRDQPKCKCYGSLHAGEPAEWKEVK